MAFSPICSAIISCKPAKTAAASANASLIYASVGISSDKCVRTKSASGCNPFSLAIMAFVRFFCLYGKYKSSTSCRVAAVIIAACKVAVNFCCVAMAFNTVFLRSVRSLIWRAVT